jgi:hypothetical protein
MACAQPHARSTAAFVDELDAGQFQRLAYAQAVSCGQDLLRQSRELLLDLN